MSGDVTGNPREVALRLRAVERLKGGGGSLNSRQSASDALGALYEMASEPSTAGSALALLHELQVHQVELELQEDELRRSRAELEATLRRQTQLYEHAPMAYFTVDRTGAVRELNLMGAAMLGCGLDQLQGRTLFTFLAPRSADHLQAMLGRLTDVPCVSGTLHLVLGDGTPRSVGASAKHDPDGRGFLLAFVDVTEPGASPAG